MRYYTPELIARGKVDDDDLLDAHEEEWDEAAARYVTYLDSVRPHMPPGLRHVDRSYYLHDSLIQAMGQQGRLFVIVLRLDTPPQSLLTFQYDLVDEPHIDREELPTGLRTPGGQVDWQYDEIEMVAGDPPTWRQSILFNNGWEVRLHFRDVQVQEVQALIPTPQPAALSLTPTT